MGRGRVKMELIPKPKERLKKFNSRKTNINKQINELTTLCNINACMIIYEPMQNKSFVWPEDNPESVRSMIELFKAQSTDENSAKRRSGVSDFFETKSARKAKEEEIGKSNPEAKYPSWNEDYDSMNEPELRRLSAALNYKSRIVRSRIQMMKMKMMQQKFGYNMNDNVIHSPPMRGCYAPQPLQMVPGPFTLQYCPTMDLNNYYSDNNAEAN